MALAALLALAALTLGLLAGLGLGFGGIAIAIVPGFTVVAAFAALFTLAVTATTTFTALATFTTSAFVARTGFAAGRFRLDDDRGGFGLLLAPEEGEDACQQAGLAFRHGSRGRSNPGFDDRSRLVRRDALDGSFLAGRAVGVG